MKPDSVAKAVEGLYAAFASVPKPSSIEACPCCHEHKDICKLLEGPLNHIPTIPLSNYAFSAFHTAGSEADFRYLLPRILQLAILDDEWYADLEVVLSKLHLAHWEKWSNPETGAVTVWLKAGFEAAIHSQNEPGQAVDSWLCGLARAHVNLEPFQGRLLQPGAEHTLRELYEWNSHRLLTKGKLTNAFWSDFPDEMRRVASWLKSPEVQSRVIPH